MLVTLFGIVTLVRLPRSLNASLPILTTLSDMTTLSSGQDVKAPSEILVTPLLIINFLHLLKYKSKSLSHVVISPVPLIVRVSSSSIAQVRFSPHVPVATIPLTASSLQISTSLSVDSIESGPASSSASAQSKELSFVSSTFSSI